jgi:predicted ABC-type ATPase
LTDLSWSDQRPIVVGLAGPNGAGKTTFYHVHLTLSGLRFVNADVLAREFDLDAYAAARMAGSLRRVLLERRESFVFETVFSDPVGDKLGFLEEARKVGYNVVLCFIGLETSGLSEERVAMRVSQGGHDVPTEKLKSRFPRTLSNLRMALRRLPHVLIYDNSDLGHPFNHVATFEEGTCVHRAKEPPKWVRPLLEMQ